MAEDNLMDFTGSESIKILRKTRGTVEDIFGKREEIESEIIIYGVLVGWGSSNTAESLNRDLVNTGVTFYLPAGTKILKDDKFSYKGETWEKVGSAQEWEAPPSFGDWAAGVVVNAKKVEG
jgi:hypothetical protein